VGDFVFGPVSCFACVGGATLGGGAPGPFDPSPPQGIPAAGPFDTLGAPAAPPPAPGPFGAAAPPAAPPSTAHAPGAGPLRPAQHCNRRVCARSQSKRERFNFDQSVLFRERS